MEVNLPGGLLKEGVLHRRIRFNELTGRLEQQLIDAAKEESRPGYVTKVLSYLVESVGDQSVDDELVSNLSVADRQFLMLCVASLLQGEQMWLKTTCEKCAQDFDVDVRRNELPIKPAGDSFPFTTVSVNDDALLLRVPTGSDQQSISEMSENEAMQQLLRNCLVSVNGVEVLGTYPESLSANDIEQIDNALDDVAPAVCDSLIVVCPECGHQQVNGLDHCALAPVNEDFFYDEIHSLALNYHWSETEILALPQRKRKIYLDLIHRSGGRG